MKSLKGKKTYIVASLMALYAVLAVYFGDLDANTALQRIMEAAALAALRNGMD